MINNQKITKNIIPIEIELGFVRIPNRYKNLFPKTNTKVKVYLADKKTTSTLAYNYKDQRITGLVKFFRSTGAKPRDILEFEKLNNKKFRLTLKKLTPREKEKLEFTQEEAKEMIDVGKIPPQVKGSIVEERIAHLIFLYGQGLLNVYKPTADIEGIDLIVVKKGIFQPIFIQVKSRYNLRGNNLQFGIKYRGFQPHHAFYVIGAYFNPQKMDIDDNIILIPSETFIKKANIINRGSDKALYVLNTPLRLNTHSRFSEFIIRKNNLVNKIFEKFKEIEKYLK